jgi:hypothetical protein
MTDRQWTRFLRETGRREKADEKEYRERLRARRRQAKLAAARRALERQRLALERQRLALERMKYRRLERKAARKIADLERQLARARTQARKPDDIDTEESGAAGARPRRGANRQ